MRYMSDQEIDRLSGAAGKRLAAEPKVEIVIAPAEGGQDVPWEGGLNGYFFRIPRGVRVQVRRALLHSSAKTSGWRSFPARRCAHTAPGAASALGPKGEFG